MKRDAAWSMRGDSISLPSISLVLENLGLTISFFFFFVVEWRGPDAGRRIRMGRKGVWADQLLNRVKEQEQPPRMPESGRTNIWHVE